jgi:Uma2 family endonuclease
MMAGTLSFEDQFQIPAEAFTFERFRDWVHSADFPDRGKISFLAGEIAVDMSPEDIQRHNRPKTDLIRDRGLWVSRHDLGHLLCDGALLVNEAIGLNHEPDLVFCGWESLLAGRVRYVERIAGSGRQVEVVGSPDLVVEIVSIGSVRKDTQLLPDLYYRAGIEEYWLIDARRAAIDFQLLVRGAEGFVNAPLDEEGYLRSDALKGRFKLTRALDRTGGFQYTLLAK